MNFTSYGDVWFRAQNDAQFRALVDVITSVALTHKYTPGELRDAAFVAAVQVENMSIQHRFVMPEDYEDKFRPKDIEQKAPRDAVMKRAYELDPDAWASYSGKPRDFKRYIEQRRNAAISKAEDELNQ